MVLQGNGGVHQLDYWGLLFYEQNTENHCT